MAESPSFRTGYMSLLLPSSTGDLEVRSSIRNMAATGDLSQGPRTIKAGARTLYRRGERISTSDLLRVCPKNVTRTVDSGARVPGR